MSGKVKQLQLKVNKKRPEKLNISGQIIKWIGN